MYVVLKFKDGALSRFFLPQMGRRSLNDVKFLYVVLEKINDKTNCVGMGRLKHTICINIDLNF